MRHRHEIGCRCNLCRKCDCEPCRTERARFMREYRASKMVHGKPSSYNGFPWEVDRVEMEVTCWCEEQIVRVSRTDVKAGRTRSCKLPRCKRMGEQ